MVENSSIVIPVTHEDKVYNVKVAMEFDADRYNSEVAPDHQYRGRCDISCDILDLQKKLLEESSRGSSAQDPEKVRNVRSAIIKQVEDSLRKAVVGQAGISAENKMDGLAVKFPAIMAKESEEKWTQAAQAGHSPQQDHIIRSAAEIAYERILPTLKSALTTAFRPAHIDEAAVTQAWEGLKRQPPIDEQTVTMVRLQNLGSNAVPAVQELARRLNQRTGVTLGVVDMVPNRPGALVAIMTDNAYRLKDTLERGRMPEALPSQGALDAAPAVYRGEALPREKQ